MLTVVTKDWQGLTASSISPASIWATTSAVTSQVYGRSKTLPLWQESMTAVRVTPSGMGRMSWTMSSNTVEPGKNKFSRRGRNSKHQVCIETCDTKYLLARGIRLRFRRIVPRVRIALNTSSWPFSQTQCDALGGALRCSLDLCVAPGILFHTSTAVAMFHIIISH